MSRTPATPEFLPLPAMLWQLLQTLWLGAHMASLLLFMPMLVKIGFAPMLLQEVNGQLRPALLVLTLMASTVQMLILARTSGPGALVSQLRGQLLLGIWLLALLVLLAYGQEAISATLIRGLYGAMLGCGLVLLTQPLPRKS
ncbi:DUF4149 domain-containing protein [Thiopseudomonas denitrificans]|uniref:Uncharacterized protein n=1 Tax=Thiopseudomonas denitrificans TaxID=1501432 RepID=A0A4R6TWJ0_9GAMM|nr:DUF4149 domain-containing protein [Thiopseudomonas denitrificans]TDQ36205.1 hypothetical protein DFQ45_11472 [Thiopseudomonas denitrificans]